MMPTLQSLPPKAHAPGRCVTCFETRLGWMALDFDPTRLHQVRFGYPTHRGLLAQIARHATSHSTDLTLPPWVQLLCDRLQDFAAGVPQGFDDVQLADNHLTPFASRVVRECRKLPWGSRVTYAELAARAGRAGAARAVGNVMATNRFPLIVPCHRVVGSGGGLGGYSAPGGLTTKRRLLELEADAVPA